MSKNSTPNSDESLRREASEWLARMQRPDADTYQARFSEWLAQDAHHREAYNRLLERFNDARILRQSDAFPPIKRQVSATGRIAASVALAIAIAAIVAWLLYPDKSQDKGDRPGTQMASAAHSSIALARLKLATPIGQIRAIKLADGSTVTLDTNSLLHVALTEGSRDLYLERGRARFSVAHESRPFVVHAAGGTVVAHGTVFDVALGAHDSVNVRLLSGVIDVTRPDRGSSSAPAMQRLQAGQRLAYGPDIMPPLVRPAAVEDISWPAGMLDFDSAPLSDILERANHYSKRPIVMADPSIAGLKVSGRFRVNDPSRLADNLARLLDLSVGTDRDGAITLRAR